MSRTALSERLSSQLGRGLHESRAKPGARLAAWSRGGPAAARLAVLAVLAVLLASALLAAAGDDPGSETGDAGAGLPLEGSSTPAKGFDANFTAIALQNLPLYRSMCIPGLGCSNRTETHGVWVTLATNREFAHAALVLGYSILRTGTRHKLLCLVTEGVPPDYLSHLRALYDIVEPVERVKIEGPETYLTDSFTKLRILEMTRFRRVVYLGADTLLLRRSDRLFQCLPPCGAVDGYVWDMSEAGTVVNGDVLVLRPDVDDYRALVEMARTWDEKRGIWAPQPRPWWHYASSCDRPRENAFIGPYDQAMFIRYYGTRFTVLPPSYNVMPFGAPRPPARPPAPQAPLGDLLSDSRSVLSVVRSWGDGDARSFLLSPASARILHYAVTKPWHASTWEDPNLVPWAQLWLDAFNEAMGLFRAWGSGWLP
eukprot:tig00020554_g10865.t1